MAKKMSAKTRHLRRIRQQIRRMEKRGYIFDEEFKNSLKYRSARSLAQIKTEGLYKRAKIKIPDLETGEVTLVSGIEGRAFERSQAALKGAATRKARSEAAPELYSEEIPDISAEVIDNLDALLFKLGQPVSEMATARDGHIFPKSSALKTYSQGAKNSLQRMLDDEVSKLNMAGENGEKVVALRIYRCADLIEQALGVVEYSAYIGEIRKAVSTFADAIKGRIRNQKEYVARDTLEMDEFWEEEFEGWTEG